MNWTMGRYLGGLDVAGRDRVIAANDFTDGAWWDGSCGCLVGTAEDIGRFFEGERCLDYQGFGTIERKHRAHMLWRHVCDGLQPYVGVRGSTAAHRYPAAVTRFGKARVVRAIKLRAAKLNGCSPDEIAKILAPTNAEVPAR